MTKDKVVCRWTSLESALTNFVLNQSGKVQSSSHIKPLHWYIACRLVLEGGFHPDEVVPHPPFYVEKVGGGALRLHYDESKGSGGERTIIGGLKTKDIDVSVAKDGIGPCVAISVKGMLNAFRNLTNRLEEAVGDCTNIHITYPALVYGFVFVMRANREGPLLKNGHFMDPDKQGNVLAADIAIRKGGKTTESILRIHEALVQLTGRKHVRDEFSRYEAIGAALVDPDDNNCGKVLKEFPPTDSPLRIESFFNRIYLNYDERFVYAAPNLANRTRRLEWSGDSPAFAEGSGCPFSEFDFQVRTAQT